MDESSQAEPDATIEPSAGGDPDLSPSGGPPRAALIGLGVLASAAAILLIVYILRQETGPVGGAGQSPTVSPAAAPATPLLSASGPPNTAAPSPAPSPTPPSGAAEVAWTAGPDLGGITRVVERIGDTWFIGGSVSANGGQQAAVWTSSDGRTWNDPTLLDPAPLPEPADAEPGDWFPDRYTVNGFEEWGGTLYAYGQYAFGCCDGYRPMLWQSADAGVDWSVVETSGTGFDTAHFPVESSTTPGGELVLYSITGLGGGAATFITAGLETWTMHPVGEFDSFNTPGGFAASPDSMIVVGSHVPPYQQGEEPRPEQRAWRSDDGRTWSPLTPPARGGELWNVTWDPAAERFVVVGSDASGQPWAWLTVDGTSWSASQLADARGEIHDISATDGLLAAVGSIEAPESEPIAWTSHDGITWWVAPINGANSVAVAGNSAVIVGWSGEGDRSETWVGLLVE